MTPLLLSTIASIDDANREDPTLHDGQPLALVQGQAASRWLHELIDAPSEELQLAVRAHHLRRWELKRADYPNDRGGYLRWRRDNKAHQAHSLGALMHTDGWPRSSVERAQILLGRTMLRTDPDTQWLEDAACLVFLETQFDDMVERTEPDRMKAITAKTLKKMSSKGVTLAGSISLSTTSQAVLADASTLLATEDSNDD